VILWFNTGTLRNIASRNCPIESSPRKRRSRLATIAFSIPRCRAIFIAQALSRDHFVERSSKAFPCSMSRLNANHRHARSERASSLTPRLANHCGMRIIRSCSRSRSAESLPYRLPLRGSDKPSWRGSSRCDAGFGRTSDGALLTAGASGQWADPCLSPFSFWTVRLERRLAPPHPVHSTTVCVFTPN
jgi:hypothetical protein